MNFPVAAVDFGAAKNSTREKKTSVCILGSWSDVNWGISDSCKPEMNVLSPLHINYPSTPTKYIVLACSFRTNRHEPLRRKTFCEHFSRQALAEKKYWMQTTNWHLGQKVKEAFSKFQYWPVIVVFQSYSEPEKCKSLVNIAMPSWEKHLACTDVTRHHCC